MSKRLNQQTDFLRKELANRLQKNNSYSMRAFARLLDINIGTLSGLLSGKRPLTVKMASDLCGRLGFSPSEEEKVCKQMSNGKTKRLSFTGEIPDRIELDEAKFSVISDWSYYAILQLVRTDDYINSSKPKSNKWIASQLGLTELETNFAVQRLVDIGLLENNEGKLKRTEKKITTANKNKTSQALKKLQKQIRERAIFSLEHDPIEIRSMTSMTMAINPKKVMEAKLLIDEFQEKLAELLEKDEREKVYQLEVSLFPIQNIKEI